MNSIKWFEKSIKFIMYTLFFLIVACSSTRTGNISSTQEHDALKAAYFIYTPGIVIYDFTEDEVKKLDTILRKAENMTMYPVRPPGWKQLLSMEFTSGKFHTAHIYGSLLILLGVREKNALWFEDYREMLWLFEKAEMELGPSPERHYQPRPKNIKGN